MSSSQRDPQPLGRAGEVALVLLAGAAVLLGVAALAGLGAASALAGGGWVWPDGTENIGRALAGLLSGHPGRGLPPELAARVPGPAAVYWAVAVSELLMLTLAAGLCVLGWRYRRPGDARRGMATRSEAAAVLGRGRLRAARTIIRPDLNGTGRRGAR